jgi:hypothetical protein
MPLNEKVRELMTKAMSETWMKEDRDGDVDKMYIPALFAETFLKLIVKECATVGLNASYDGDGLEGFDASDAIYKHFGMMD